MIHGEPQELHCAACKRSAMYGGNPGTKTPLFSWEDQLPDGRPGKEAWVLERLAHLGDCPHCGHVSPFIDKTFPRMTPLPAGAFADHSEQARRYLRVAHLYGMDDPREQGFWILRAAWADDSAGMEEPAQKLRREAAPLLEESVAQGYALYPGHGATLVALTDIHRVAGEFDRALDHCRRGLLTTPRNEWRVLLVWQAHLIFERSPARVTNGNAVNAAGKVGSARRVEIHRRVAAERPVPSGWPKSWGGRCGSIPSPSFWDLDSRVQRAAAIEMNGLPRIIKAVTRNQGILGCVRDDDGLLPMLLRMTAIEDERGDNARKALEEIELTPRHAMILADHPDAVDTLERAYGVEAPIASKVKALVEKWKDHRPQ